MKYTKEQLQMASKFELGKALALLAGRVIADEQYFNYQDRDENVVLLFPQGESFSVDNPSDIMPLAFEHKLCIDWLTDGRCLVAQQYIKTDDIQYQSENPLRAIACCLILVLQEQ